MSFIKYIFQETFGSKTETTELASQPGQTKKGSPGYSHSIAPKSISQTRQDIKNWTDALNMAQKSDDPKRYPLYNLYENIVTKDLHLQSQLNNRMRKSLSRPFVFKDLKGNVNQELTDLLQNSNWVYQVNKAILETVHYGHSIGEFEYDAVGNLKFILIPRQNIDPVNGLLYLDYTEDKKIKYREQKEYGSWLIEFGEPKDLGLLNGCVPEVLMKRFAKSCWSELCEIYGIPPRVMKTNTQDRTMVSRAEKMMRDMGSAAWFIIDESEAFEFAKGVDTNGDVFNNLIKVCNNEMSMGISGTVVGQDTKNGSNSKEKTSIEILQDLIDSDLSLLELYWNSVIIPAGQILGVIPAGAVYGYDETEDLDALWDKVIKALPYYDVEVEWMKTKFGIPFIEKKVIDNNNQKLSLNIGDGLFI